MPCLRLPGRCFALLYAFHGLLMAARLATMSHHFNLALALLEQLGGHRVSQ